MAVSAGLGLAIGVTTPPRSGSFCTAACVTYPYTNVAAFVPGDYIWMYPAMLATLLLVIVAVCIAELARGARAPLGRIGAAFAVMAGSILAVDYFVQLAVVQPSLIKGETDGLALLSMYNPHGIAIALEDIGYFVMGLAFVALAAALPPSGRLARGIVGVLASGGVLLVAGLPTFGAALGPDLGYTYEVFAIAVGWSALIVAGAMLSVLFRGERRNLFGRSGGIGPGSARRSGLDLGDRSADSALAAE